MSAVTIRGTAYPVVLPKISDPRLHLAAVITTLQVLGQVAFHFRLSIAQILVSLLTCAVLEVAITLRRQHVLMWPASALLTGNGVAFILRVPGTQHGDWWSMNGWWIFMATAAVSLLSKYVIVWRQGHIFNPSNFGLVLCFLVLGRTRAEPLDFWWGPMSWWMALALAVILIGGFAILSRLRLLWLALAFWATFATGIAILAAAGHEMTARWHLGPLSGFELWWVLVTSPEVLVFLFFMITDPKTSPRSPRARIAYAVSIGLLATLLIAPMYTEWATKVALLSALTVVCLTRPFAERVRLSRPRVAAVAAVGVAALATALAFSSGPAASHDATVPARGLPPITIERSEGVQTQLTMPIARSIVHDLVRSLAPTPSGRVRVRLRPGEGQDPPFAEAELAGMTYRLHQSGARWVLAAGSAPPAPLRLPVLASYRLRNVARQVGLDFRQGSFRFGVTSDNPAMMGGGLCWLDYNNDGWLDLFVVNGYGEGDIGAYSARGGLPRTALFRNDDGRFVNVTAKSGAGLPVRGEGCVAADFNGDGFTDIFVTTSQDDVLLWNNGNGTFTEGARSHGIFSFGWHSGAAVADVNGDGRPDLFVAGYTEANGPVPGSMAGFPTNHLGVRDLLFLNEGNGADGRARFKEVGRRVGLDRPPYDHSLGAEFTDVNGDGRPDLYVANDEDPNRLYVNERGGPLGFHFVDAARRYGVADRNAGMGIAYDGTYLFVSNSRRQTHAVYRRDRGLYTDVRRAVTPALGANLTGWGDAWVDLGNDGSRELVLANGAIPVTNLARDAAPIQVLEPSSGRWRAFRVAGLPVNGRGLAAADYDNDGRVDVAVNTVGGRLILLHNTSRSGHWLEVRLRRFVPGAVVSATLPNGRRLVQELHAGSSYLSSEDPRAHFGLGPVGRLAKLTVRYPGGGTVVLRDVAADRIVTAPLPD